MKAFFVLLVLAVCISCHDFRRFQQQPTCSSNMYRRRGEDCDRTQNRFCKMFLTCVGGTCQDSYPGSPCKTDPDCRGQMTRQVMICLNQRCVKQKYNGVPCRTDRECLGGTCKPAQSGYGEGFCAGIPEGRRCNYRNPVECDVGLWCSNKTRGGSCVRQRGEGAECEYTGRSWQYPIGHNYYVQCEAGTRCMYNPNKGGVVCTVFRDKASGSPCFDAEQCQFGLTCVNNVCAEPIQIGGRIPCPGNPTGNCSDSRGEMCVCDVGKSTGTCKQFWNPNCNWRDAFNEYRQCWAKNKCAFDNFYDSLQTDSFPQAETCMSKNCGHIARKYMCCELDGFENSPWSWAARGVLPCGGIGPGGVAGIVISVLIVVGLAAVVIGVAIFFIVKRRKAGFVPLN